MIRFRESNRGDAWVYFESKTVLDDGTSKLLVNKVAPLLFEYEYLSIDFNNVSEISLGAVQTLKSLYVIAKQKKCELIFVNAESFNL